MQEILEDILDTGYVKVTAVVQQDGAVRASAPTAMSGVEGLSGPLFVGFGALRQLSYSADMGDFRYALIDTEEGILLVASLDAEHVLGIWSKPEANRGLLLSGLMDWVSGLKELV